jgi:hypothetical protein
MVDLASDYQPACRVLCAGWVSEVLTERLDRGLKKGEVRHGQVGGREEEKRMEERLERGQGYP